MRHTPPKYAVPIIFRICIVHMRPENDPTIEKQLKNTKTQATTAKRIIYLI